MELREAILELQEAILELQEAIVELQETTVEHQEAILRVQRLRTLILLVFAMKIEVLGSPGSSRS